MSHLSHFLVIHANILRQIKHAMSSRKLITTSHAQAIDNEVHTDVWQGTCPFFELERPRVLYYPWLGLLRSKDEALRPRRRLSMGRASSAASRPTTRSGDTSVARHQHMHRYLAFLAMISFRSISFRSIK